MTPNREDLPWYKGSAFYLLIALGVVFLLNTGRERDGMGDGIVAALIYFTITLLAVRAISSRGRPILLAACISGPLLAISEVAYSQPDDQRIVPMILLLVVLLFTSGALLRATLRTEKVTADKIFAAMCVYILLGLIWAVLFRLLYVHDSMSLSIPPLLGEDGPLTGRNVMAQLTYFSFTTLTTLGYGDITPKSIFARNLATFEAVVGQLYIATMLARLVALQITHASRTTRA